MAISRILSGRRGDRMIIYLTRISPRVRRTFIRRDATIPEDFSGPAALPLFCLAPRGVFPASRITPRAVSSYLAFSPLPVPLLPKNRRCLFCDTFRRRDPAAAGLRRPRFLRGMSPYGVRTFLQQAASGSPAIICHRHQINTIKNAGKQEQNIS
jgi:hypothetical protein